MTVIDTLAAWGADPESALRRLADDHEFYIHLLKEFIQDPALERLRLALNQKQYQKAFLNAHELKGVAANLSLTPLVQSLSRMVEDLRGQTTPGPEFQEHFIKMTTDLDELRLILREADINNKSQAG